MRLYYNYTDKLNNARERFLKVNKITSLSDELIYFENQLYNFSTSGFLENLNIRIIYVYPYLILSI